MKRLIAILLHAYQPWNQLRKITDEIIRESYEPVIRAIEDHPFIFVSLDIAGVLIKQLPKELLDRIRLLYQNQRIELVNTAYSHFLLPLVPEHAAARQLQLNRKLYEENFTGY